jgi:hypothetical protein
VWAALHDASVALCSCESKLCAVHRLNVAKGDMVRRATGQTLERLTKALNLCDSKLVEANEWAVIRTIFEVVEFHARVRSGLT